MPADTSTHPPALYPSPPRPSPSPPGSLRCPSPRLHPRAHPLPRSRSRPAPPPPPKSRVPDLSSQRGLALPSTLRHHFWTPPHAPHGKEQLRAPSIPAAPHPPNLLLLPPHQAPDPPSLLVRPGWALSPSQGGLRQPSVTTPPPWHEHEAPLTSSPSFSSVSSPLSCSFGRFLNASFSGLGESRGGAAGSQQGATPGWVPWPAPPNLPLGKSAPGCPQWAKRRLRMGQCQGGPQVPRFYPGGFG